MRKTIKEILLGLAGVVMLGGFTWKVMKGHFEPNYPDAVIQYKSGTVTPLYSGFDRNNDGDIDSINVFRAQWLGYQNYSLIKGDSNFKEIKELLQEQSLLESKADIYSGMRRVIK